MIQNDYHECTSKACKAKSTGMVLIHEKNTQSLHHQIYLIIILMINQLGQSDYFNYQKFSN